MEYLRLENRKKGGQHFEQIPGTLELHHVFISCFLHNLHGSEKTIEGEDKLKKQNCPIYKVLYKCLGGHIIRLAQYFVSICILRTYKEMLLRMYNAVV